ncbi:MAG: molecular chaperone TorD family protein [Haloarculaceae archaeon]
MSETPAAPADDADADAEAEVLSPTDLRVDATALGGLYTLLARGFRHPDDELHAAAADGRLREEVETLVERADLDVSVPPLSTDDDAETLSARYNDLFVIGYSEYDDPTDGSLSATGPPVSLYESSYRDEVSWNDVNLDLARAYEYFGAEPDTEFRDHHDALPVMLEFTGYLCRLAATGEAGLDDARLDLIDRHVSYAVEGVADRLDAEADPGLYGDLGRLARRVVDADRDALVAAREAAGGGEST